MEISNGKLHSRSIYPCKDSSVPFVENSIQLISVPTFLNLNLSKSCGRDEVLFSVSQTSIKLRVRIFQTEAH